MAYVAQTAWIQNGTIEENILFGKPMHRERYEDVIRVCCMEKDLEMMEFGDQTEIGERGTQQQTHKMIFFQLIL
jgi:ABC-type multidrug transport system fused ATPase/permease subunit